MYCQQGAAAPCSQPLPSMLNFSKQQPAICMYTNNGAQLLLPLQWGGSRTWMVGAAALRAGSATSLATLTPALTTGAATSTADLTTGATCGMGGKTQYPCH